MPLPRQPPPRFTRDIAHERLVVGTRRPQQSIDVTELVLCCALASGVCEGAATVQSMRNTAAILMNEGAPLLLDDLDRWQRILPVELDGPRSRKVVVTTASPLGVRLRILSLMGSDLPALVEERT